MSSVDVTVELIQAIVENLNPHGKEWDALSAVIDVKDGMFPAARTEGFLYSADGFVGAAGIKAYDIGPAVRAYMESYYTDGAPWPLRILVQFERATGRYQVLFEESDSNRWMMTPDTMEAVREELKPNFS